MDFQKTASILFCVNVTYVSVCYINLHNDNEVIDRMGGGIEMIHQLHKHPPSIVQLEEDTLSLLSSDTLSSLLSNNSSISLTSVRLTTNSDDDDLFPSSSQSTQSENKCANYVLSFCDWAMGTISEDCYGNPHQERCVGKMMGAKMSHCKHKGCKVGVHNICQIDWLKRHCFEGNQDDPIFC
jgi:hypothetical protein